jgi:murein DD-endopeptidase MepM/ murein hydrolase activator NlpD
VKSGVSHRWKSLLERTFPEQRLFLRSDTETRFVRLKPGTQAVALSGGAIIVGWAIVATAILLMDSIGSGNARDQALRDQENYELRLDELAQARDSRAAEAMAAQQRFNAALATISQMQSNLLTAEDHRRELETGIDAVQRTLRQMVAARDTAKAEIAQLEARIAGELPLQERVTASPADVSGTLDFMTAALNHTATERDTMLNEALAARAELDAVAFERELILDRNDRIFSQLEEALTVSVAPLDKMFRDAGLPPDQLIETVRRGYSGQGGPLMPMTFSSSNSASGTGNDHDPDTLRANAILNGLDKMNLYRLAAEKAPFALPVKRNFRYTSGFGPRWGRMHNGTDFAGPTGTPIYATADGVVTHAGWQSGYGRLVKIKHAFGIETRYAHQSRIRVKVGDRVSRGDRIGDMGNSGRSTGTHLHYEVRVGGKPVNPMIYIKAARDVF